MPVPSVAPRLGVVDARREDVRGDERDEEGDGEDRAAVAPEGRSSVVRHAVPERGGVARTRESARPDPDSFLMLSLTPGKPASENGRRGPFHREFDQTRTMTGG